MTRLQAVQIKNIFLKYLSVIELWPSGVSIIFQSWSAARIHSTRSSLNIVSLRVTRYCSYFFARIAAAALREADLVATLEEDRFALLLAEAATEEARTSA